MFKKHAYLHIYYRQPGIPRHPGGPRQCWQFRWREWPRPLPSPPDHGDREDPAAHDRLASRTASTGCTPDSAKLADSIPGVVSFGEYELREAPERPPAVPPVYSSPCPDHEPEIPPWGTAVDGHLDDCVLGSREGTCRFYFLFSYFILFIFYGRQHRRQTVGTYFLLLFY